MSDHTEKRLEASLLLRKLRKREPGLGRQLDAVITQIVKHQDQVIIGLKKRNEALERMHEKCKHPDYGAAQDIGDVL